MTVYNVSLENACLQNLAVERIWPQVNSRVNYPIKRILIQMNENQLIDMTDPTDKYCVSHVAAFTAAIGLQRLVSSWNFHPISGRGINFYSKF